jgi:hypothetical protein
VRKRIDKMRFRALLGDEVIADSGDVLLLEGNAYRLLAVLAVALGTYAVTTWLGTLAWPLPSRWRCSGGRDAPASSE